MNSLDDGKNPYGITCPTCASRPGERCKSRTGRGPTVYGYPHITREQRAADCTHYYRRQQEARQAILRRRSSLSGDQQEKEY